MNRLRVSGLWWYLSMMDRRWVRDLIRPSLYIRSNLMLTLASTVLLQLVRLVSFPAASLMGRRGYIIIPVLSSRLGHLVTEPLVASAILGPGEREKRLLLVPSNLTVNPEVARRFEQRFRIVTSPLVCLLLEGVARNRRIGFDSWSVASSPGREILYAACNRSGSLQRAAFAPTESDIARRQEILDDLGVGDQRYVCLSFRPLHTSDHSGYRDNIDTTSRSRSLEDVLPVAYVAADLGFVPILMGGSDQPAVPSDSALIDYPHSSWKSPEADVLLAQGCSAWIGDTSGVSALALMFGRPRLLVDWLPVASMFHHGAEVVVVPRIPFSRESGRVVNLLEPVSARILKEFRPRSLAALGVEWRAVPAEVTVQSIQQYLTALPDIRPRQRAEERLMRQRLEGELGLATGMNSLSPAFFDHYLAVNQAET